jgi:hypothetical protein
MNILQKAAYTFLEQIATQVKARRDNLFALMEKAEDEESQKKLLEEARELRIKSREKKAAKNFLWELIESSVEIPAGVGIGIRAGFKIISSIDKDDANPCNCINCQTKKEVMEALGNASEGKLAGIEVISLRM